MDRPSDLPESKNGETTEKREVVDVPRDSGPSRGATEAIQGKTDAELRGEWIELGVQNVPVSKIDVSDTPVRGRSDFLKVSYDEMRDGLIKLNDKVMPAVERGAGGEDFSQLDAELGLEYGNGYRKVYDKFYGDTAIKLNKVDDTYTVVNGYHRLFVARGLAHTTVPAFVKELQRKETRL